MSRNNEYLMTLAALELIEKEGYKIIDVRIIGKEIWLNHPANTRELIRLSLNGAFAYRVRKNGLPPSVKPSNAFLVNGH